MLLTWTRRKKTVINERMIYGIVGTAVSATGASLSATELQAIVSIIITILGFVISVLIPLGIKFVKWLRKAKADGKIDDQELDELGQIVNEGKEGLTQLQKDLGESEKEVSEKSEGDK